MLSIGIGENTVKTKLAYQLAHSIGPVGYLEASNFRNHYDHNNFMDIFNKSLSLNKDKLPSIKHSLKEYGKLPIWVATQIISLGCIHKIFNRYKSI